MSMIDCKVHVEKKPHPAGDRVVLTFECVTAIMIHCKGALMTMQRKILTLCKVVECDVQSVLISS